MSKKLRPVVSREVLLLQNPCNWGAPLLPGPGEKSDIFKGGLHGHTLGMVFADTKGHQAFGSMALPGAALCTDNQPCLGPGSLAQRTDLPRVASPLSSPWGPTTIIPGICLGSRCQMGWPGGHICLLQTFKVQRPASSRITAHEEVQKRKWGVSLERLEHFHSCPGETVTYHLDSDSNLPNT